MGEREKSREELLLEVEELQRENQSLKAINSKKTSELEHSKRILHDFIDKNPMSIQIVDKDGYTLQVNSAHTKLFGAVPPPNYSVFNDNQLIEQGFADLIRKVRAGEVVYFPDFSYNVHSTFSQFPDIPIWIRMLVFPLNGDDGLPNRYILIHENITEQKQAEKALIENEKNYRSLLDLAPIAFFQGNENGDIIMANKKAAVLTGYSSQEILSMNMKDFFSPSTLNEKPLRYDLLDKGEIVTFEREIIQKNGSVIPVEMSSRRMPNMTYQSFIKDISEQVKAENAIKESEHLYRAIFENTGSSSIIIEEDTTIALVNSEWVNLSGYSHEELEGKMSWTQFVVPEDLVKMREYHSSRRKGSSDVPHKYEFRFIRRNGEIRNMINCVGMIPESKRSIASLMDITELKQAEETLRKSEERMRAIIETSPDGIAITSLDGTVQFLTQKTLSLWGYDSMDEIVGRNVLEFVEPAYQEKATYFINEMLSGNLTGVAEYLMVRKDGSKFFCESNANVLKDLNDKPFGILYINRDITQRKQVENDLIKAKEDAEASEKKYRLIIENAPLGIIHFNNLGEITSCNEKFVEIIGSSREVLIGLNMINLPDKSIVQAVQRTLQGEMGFYNDDYHSVTANKVTPVQIVFAPIFSKCNEVIGGVGIVEDITERKKNEQAIKKQNEEYLALNEELQQTNDELYRAKKMVEESEAFLLNIFENIPNMIFIKNADDLSFFSVNKAGEQFLGLTKEELVGKTDYDFFPKEQADFFTAKDRAVFGSDKCLVIEEENIDTKFGKKILYTKKIAIKDSDGNSKYLLGISDDITEKKEIQNELIKAKEKAEENEAKYSSIVRILPDGVIIHSNGKIVFMNDAALKIIKGKSFDDYIGQPVINFVHPDYRELALQRIKNSFVDKKYTELIEEAFIDSNNNPVYVLVAGSPFKYQGQASMLTVFTDISRIKAAEQELIKAKEKAEESDRLKTAFLANMSHEIRTPMNGIIGFAELLKKPQLTGEQQKEYIEVIERSGARMLNIINDIIDISKIESGEVKISITETNINEQFDYLYNFFKPEAESKRLIFSHSTSLPANEAYIQTDSAKFYAILSNLIKNAIKFTEMGTVEFGYNKVEDLLQFYVRDTGIGIPEDRYHAIFERFVQADISDRRAYQGAGLGLSISKAYVEMLGGKIWFESEENKGSIFYFTIPYTQAPSRIETSRSTLDSKTIQEIRRLKILIAEDDETSDLFLTLLLRNFNCEILHAKTGNMAVEICKNNPDIDLILMDIKMPEMNGYEATMNIRQFNSKVVIFAQTAHALSGDKEKALEAGCNDYVAKPISPALLSRLIIKYFIN